MEVMVLLQCKKTEKMGKPKSAVTAQPPLRKRFERLPKLVKPVNYSITFKPDFKTNTFEGTEDIDVEVI